MSGSAAQPELVTPSFFGLVHNVLEARRAGERRQTARSDFACLQLLAPYGEGRLPDAAEFIRVRCRDLSITGFSYLADKRPRTEYLLVALGDTPYMFVSAQVLYARPVQSEGRQQLTVGCRFLRRIEAQELARDLGRPDQVLCAAGEVQ